MKILILEKDEKRIEKFNEVFQDEIVFVTADPAEAIRLTKNHKFSLICAEYDLQCQKGYFTRNMVSDVDSSGQMFAEFLARFAHLSFDATIIIHSNNALGAAYMERTLKRSRSGTIRHMPFTRLIAQLQSVFEAGKKFPSLSKLETPAV